LIDLVEKKPIPDLSQSRLISNFNFFAGKIADLELQPKDVYEAIGKLQIVNITLDRNVDDAQAIFESLNSTGKELSESDCQTAHCGRCEQHFIVGAFTSPTVRFGR
jgi:uncharacterized protein with ParB-like and HNH nuclease domain